MVDGDFHVEDQHNWITFPLAMPPGEHVVTAESDSGASLEESFRTPDHGTRHAVIDYWDDDNDPTTFSWLFRRQPIVHA